MPNIAAGWYPDASDRSLLRYWDGAQWTAHTAPVAQVSPVASTAPTQVYPATPGVPQQAAPTGAVGLTPPAPYAAPVTKPKMSAAKKWLIGGGIAAGVLVVGGIGNAIGVAGNKPDPAGWTQAAAAAPTVAPSVVPTPTPEAAQPTAEARLRRRRLQKRHRPLRRRMRRWIRCRSGRRRTRTWMT